MPDKHAKCKSLINMRWCRPVMSGKHAEYKSLINARWYEPVMSPIPKHNHYEIISPIFLVNKLTNQSSDK